MPAGVSVKLVLGSLLLIGFIYPESLRNMIVACSLEFFPKHEAHPIDNTAVRMSMLYNKLTWRVSILFFER